MSNAIEGDGDVGDDTPERRAMFTRMDEMERDSDIAALLTQYDSEPMPLARIAFLDGLLSAKRATEARRKPQR